MEKVFSLSNDDKSKFWIETNDAQVGLSEIQILGGYCIVPNHIYEDSLVEEEILDEAAIFEKSKIMYPEILLNKIQEARIKSYRACVWYDDIKDKIPTARSMIASPNSNKQLKSILRENLAEYPFVKICTMSPKDIKPIPLYDDWFEAYNDLKNSERTGNIFKPPFCTDLQGKHLFLREKREYEWEARCFWSRDKLRAVSLPINHDFDNNDKDTILHFFSKYGKYIPYHSATLDIGKIVGSEKDIELIEFNTFGPDMNATAGNFSWYEDVMVLLFSPNPIFR